MNNPTYNTYIYYFTIFLKHLVLTIVKINSTINSGKLNMCTYWKLLLIRRNIIKVGTL